MNHGVDVEARDLHSRSRSFAQEDLQPDPRQLHTRSRSFVPEDLEPDPRDPHTRSRSFVPQPETRDLHDPPKYVQSPYLRRQDSPLNMLMQDRQAEDDTQLPELSISQPNQYAQAEMQCTLQTSFLDDCDTQPFSHNFDHRLNDRHPNFQEQFQSRRDDFKRQGQELNEFTSFDRFDCYAPEDFQKTYQKGGFPDFTSREERKNSQEDFYHAPCNYAPMTSAGNYRQRPDEVETKSSRFRYDSYNEPSTSHSNFQDKFNRYSGRLQHSSKPIFEGNPPQARNTQYADAPHHSSKMLKQSTRNDPYEQCTSSTRSERQSHNDYSLNATVGRTQKRPNVVHQQRVPSSTQVKGSRAVVSMHRSPDMGEQCYVPSIAPVTPTVRKQALQLHTANASGQLLFLL